MTEASIFGAQNIINMKDNYLVLSRKWRPQSFDDVIGQVSVTQTIQNALKQNRLAHGYLFTGSRGVGKTTVARILSRVVNCSNANDYNPCNSCSTCIDILKGNNFDVIELDGASNRGIDEIRDLRESVKYPPVSGKYKVFIIDEVHMLTKEAFNALLKTLEEPPSHVLFILATTDPHKIPQTILSRTQRFNFKRISIDDICSHLSFILKSEDKSFEEDALVLISNKADGSMRDALSFLDQVIAYGEDSINVKNVSESIGLIDSIIYCRLLYFIISSELPKTLSIVNDSINSGYSISDFINGFIDFLNKCLHVRLNSNSSQKTFFNDKVLDALTKMESILSIDLLVQTLEWTIQFENKLKFVSQPMIALEAHFVKLAYINGDSSSISIEQNFSKVIEDSSSLNSKPIKDSSESEVSSDETHDSSAELDADLDVNAKEDVSELEDANKHIDDISEKDNSKAVADSEDDNLSLGVIGLGWKSLVEMMESKHPKTAGFLSDIVVESYKDGKLNLVIMGGTQFHINSLENDIEIINKEFSLFFKQEMEVSFKVQKNTKKKEIEDKPEQHPLLSKTIDLLNGEVI